MTRDTILLLQKSERTSGILAAGLSRRGFRLFTAHNIDAGLVLLRSNQVDLVIVQPDAWPDEPSMWTRLRETSSVPVLAIGEATRREEVIAALEHGADAFLLHESGAEVIAAQVIALLRRCQHDYLTQNARTDAEHAVAYDDGILRIEPLRRRVTLNGTEVQLTPTEFRLLAYLLENAGIPLTFDQILGNVWGWESTDHSYVHTYISQLRAKLCDAPTDPRYIFSEYGIGYVFRRDKR